MSDAHAWLSLVPTFHAQWHSKIVPLCLEEDERTRGLDSKSSLFG